jgi:hypothetical protein
MYSGDEIYDDEVTSGLLDSQPRKETEMATITARCGDERPHGAHPMARGRFCGGNLYPAIEAVDGCPDCGQDIDRLGGNPDCETCAAEPPAVRGQGDISPEYEARLRAMAAAGERLLDVGFVVSVNEVPEHLVELVRAFVGMTLEASTEDLLEAMDETPVMVHGKSTTDLSDADRIAVALLNVNVSVTLR